jgi:restriction endonuclease S subunit
VKTASNNWNKESLSELVDAVREQSRIEVNQTYELWSIPSFADGKPEIIIGSEIGSSKLKVSAGDVLISKINPRINRVWIVSESNLEQLASPEWLVARIKDNEVIDKKYLSFYLSSPEFRDWISRAASSVTGSHSRAKSNEILQRDIPLPEIDEQRKIVELLEEYLACLEAALADVKQAKTKAAQFRRSLLQAAFTGNLEPGGGGSKFELPSGWKTQTLKDWGMQAQSGFASGSHNSEGNGIIHLRPMNVSRLGKLDFDNFKSVEDNSNRRINKGDILFNNTNSAELVGKTAIVDIEGDFAFSNHMTRLRFPADTVAHEYMAILLHSFWMSGYFNEICSNHVNQASVSIKKLEQVEVSLPNIDEQNRIAEFLNKQLSRLDISVSIADAMEVQSIELRRSILQAAFTGQLTNEVLSV